ncbi:MAG: formyltransferase family protein [Candidatus Nanoarchaeia archaeon]|jgi:folate-dependent phosphoribosylglycinamide formyltransferase PurN
MLKVLVMASGGATSGRYLFDNNPGTYEIAGVVLSKNSASGIEHFENRGFLKGKNLFVCDVYDFYKSKGKNSLKDSQTRIEYEASIEDAIKDVSFDVIALSGYMLRMFTIHNKYNTLNVHPADLRIINDKCERKYTGDNAVTCAIRAGEKETRSSIHLVTDEVDGGPLIVVSDSVKVPSWNNSNLETIANNVQEEMKIKCDNPAYMWTIQNLANENLKIENKVIYYKNKILQSPIIL